MRKLSTIQKREKLNTVYALDERGAGGASHEYRITPNDGYEPLLFPKRAASSLSLTSLRSKQECSHGLRVRRGECRLSPTARISTVPPTPMEQASDWADGLLLRADGYACEFYRKQ